jgi:hypothetical protein
MRTALLVGCMFAPALVAIAQQNSVALQLGVPDNHCSVIQGTSDGRIFACQVWDDDPQEFTLPRRLELYRDRTLIATIEPGVPILEWWFSNNGAQISLRAGDIVRLYDAVTGQQIAQARPMRQPSDLPVWAKDRAQLDDESVPEGPAYVQQRTLWIAKVMRQIQAIHPGMTRRDLLSIMTTEGGISTRRQQTFVYRGCPYIKIDVVFAPTAASEDDDPIVTISHPWLQFSVID